MNSSPSSGNASPFSLLQDKPPLVLSQASSNVSHSDTLCVHVSMCKMGFCWLLFVCWYLGAKWRSDRNACAQQVELRGWLTEWSFYWKWKCHWYLLYRFITPEQNCLNAILKRWCLAQIREHSCSNTLTISDHLLINWIRCVTESNIPASLCSRDRLRIQFNVGRYLAYAYDP